MTYIDIPMKINNYLETKIRELNSIDNKSFEFQQLYADIQDERLRNILTWTHGELIRLFRALNTRLPTDNYEAHFWAAESRALIYFIELSLDMQSYLKNTALAFTIDPYYEDIIKKCRDFLCPSGGSNIPPNMKKIELYYTIPIFVPSTTLKIENSSEIKMVNLKSLGEGSYANVYKFEDEFYGKEFVLKRAKKNLTDKELIRFEREFSEMKMLKSPYVVEVYKYNPDKHEYIMELMDSTLEKYIASNNERLTKKMRYRIILQLLKAYQYLHSKKIFHRDISPWNVLVKEYDDTLIVKIADFGLVKIVDSQLTSKNSEFKGSFNDPSLRVTGFDNYNLSHEIYAITLLFAYILTGKINFSKIKNIHIQKFIGGGTNPDLSKRYGTLEELKKAIEECVNLI